MVPEDSLINVVDVCSSITVKYCMRARVVKGQQETKNLAHSRERYLFFIVLYVMFICVYHRDTREGSFIIKTNQDNKFFLEGPNYGNILMYIFSTGVSNFKGGDTNNDLIRIL